MTLAPRAERQTATATLRIVEAGNFPPSACGTMTAAGIRVYPPNQTRVEGRAVPLQRLLAHGPGDPEGARGAVAARATRMMIRVHRPPIEAPPGIRGGAAVGAGPVPR